MIRRKHYENKNYALDEWQLRYEDVRPSGTRIDRYRRPRWIGARNRSHSGCAWMARRLITCIKSLREYYGWNRIYHMRV